MTRKALSVARWEFVERVKTKSFLIGLVLTPLIMASFIVGPSLLKDSLAKKESSRIAVVDGTGQLFDSLKVIIEKENRLISGNPRYELLLRSGEQAVISTVDRDILTGTIEGAIIIPATVFDSLSVTYRSQNVSDIEAMSGLEQLLSRLIASKKLESAGLDPHLVAELNRRTNLTTVRVTDAGASESGFLESFGISYVFIIMLMIMILTSGQFLVRSLVEEKSNRIVEILISSCSPMDLMFGKIIGLSALGLVQVVAWLAMLLVAVLVAGVSNLPLENLWLMFLYFALGFVLYATLFVMFGSLASTEQEAQQMTSYLSLFLSLPLVIAFIATQNPNSGILTVLSMIPFLTPSLMLLRLPLITPPVWEIAATLGILVLSILFFTWVASKIFRIGILMTGKRPSLDEIVRWIRS